MGRCVPTSGLREFYSTKHRPRFAQIHWRCQPDIFSPWHSWWRGVSYKLHNSRPGYLLCILNTARARPRVNNRNILDNILCHQIFTLTWPIMMSTSQTTEGSGYRGDRFISATSPLGLRHETCDTCVGDPGTDGRLRVLRESHHATRGQRWPAHH